MATAKKKSAKKKSAPKKATAKKGRLISEETIDGFTFTPGPEDGHYVVTGKNGKKLGTITGKTVPGKRHSFDLGIKGSTRNFRGKVMAAQALQDIADLISESKRSRWSPEQLVIAAWDKKSQASVQYAPGGGARKAKPVKKSTAKKAKTTKKKSRPPKKKTSRPTAAPTAPAA